MNARGTFALAFALAVAVLAPTGTHEARATNINPTIDPLTLPLNPPVRNLLGFSAVIYDTWTGAVYYTDPAAAGWTPDPYSNRAPHGDLLKAVLRTRSSDALYAAGVRGRYVAGGVFFENNQMFVNGYNTMTSNTVNLPHPIPEPLTSEIRLVSHTYLDVPAQDAMMRALVRETGVPIYDGSIGPLPIDKNPGQRLPLAARYAPNLAARAAAATEAGLNARVGLAATGQWSTFSPQPAYPPPTWAYARPVGGTGIGSMYYASNTTAPLPGMGQSYLTSAMGQAEYQTAMAPFNYLAPVKPPPTVWQTLAQEMTPTPFVYQTFVGIGGAAPGAVIGGVAGWNIDVALGGNGITGSHFFGWGGGTGTSATTLYVVYGKEAALGAVSVPTLAIGFVVTSTLVAGADAEAVASTPSVPAYPYTKMSDADRAAVAAQYAQLGNVSQAYLMWMQARWAATGSWLWITSPMSRYQQGNLAWDTSGPPKTTVDGGTSTNATIVAEGKMAGDDAYSAAGWNVFYQRCYKVYSEQLGAYQYFAGAGADSRCKARATSAGYSGTDWQTFVDACFDQYNVRCSAGNGVDYTATINY